MSYRFTSAESVDDGIRRIVIEQLDDASEKLTAGLADDPVTAVHEARKDMKKARSAIRLVRESLGEKLYRAENNRLRSASRRLSNARDAAVKRETLAALAERYGDELGEESRAAIDDATAAVNAIPADARGLLVAAAEAVEEIEMTRLSVETWSLRKRDWGAISGGIERAYRRGRAALRELERRPTDEAVHDLRKRAKDLWYHQRLLHDAWPGALGASVDELHELTDLLGDHHDLAVLELDLATDLTLTIAERDALAQTITTRKDELLERAINLGSRVYAEKPNAYTRRLRAYWRIWRS